MKGPWDTKVAPVESTLGPWIRVGYENKLIIVTPSSRFIIYSAKAASNFLVSEKGSRNKTDSLVCEDHVVILCFNIYWQYHDQHDCKERLEKKHLEEKAILELNICQQIFASFIGLTQGIHGIITLLPHQQVSPFLSFVGWTYVEIRKCDRRYGTVAVTVPLRSYTVCPSLIDIMLEFIEPSNIWLTNIISRLASAALAPCKRVKNCTKTVQKDCSWILLT